MGIIANMHLHKNVDYIEKLKDATDEHIKKILEQMSEKVMKFLKENAVEVDATEASTEAAETTEAE